MPKKDISKILDAYAADFNAKLDSFESQNLGNNNNGDIIESV